MCSKKAKELFDVTVKALLIEDKTRPKVSFSAMARKETLRV